MRSALVLLNQIWKSKGEISKPAILSYREQKYKALIWSFSPG